MGPDLLDLAVPGLGGLAVEPGHRAARHGPGLAPPRFPALLAVEVQAPPGRAPAARPRDSPADPPDGAGESDVGPTADPGGTRPPRARGRRADRHQVHAPHV